MAEGAGSILPRFERRRRSSFVLTSLIDVIFLLVIFFMVSSQIVPFSLIGLGPVAREGADAPSLPATEGKPPIAIRILAGRISIGGETMPVEALAGALAALKGDGVTGLLLVPTASAAMQDMVFVLEAAKSAGIANVTVLNPRKAAP